MENSNRYEGGIEFGGDSIEVQAQEYRTVRRPKFSSNPGRESDIYKDRKEEYIRDIEKKYGLTGNRWKFLIGKYFDFNRDLIDPNQEDLDGKVLEEIFNEYGAKNSLDINSRLDSMLSSKQEKVVITEKLESPQVVEDSGVKKTGLQSIELSPEQQAEIEARKANYQYPTRIAKDGDYVRGMTLPEWLQIEEGSSEHTTLIKGIKTNGIMPSLGKLGSNIKDQKANNDISGEYLAFINATREFYGLAPYVSEPEELVLENPTVNQLEFDLDGQQEPTPVVETESGTTPPVEDVRSTGEEDTPTQEISEVQATDASTEDEGETLPGVGELQQELDRLIAVESKKLQRDQNTENISYKIDQEKLENFKENARKNISDYQKFASEHSSPVDKSNPKIQERYQLLEKQAWNSLYNLAHLLDGEIATLPQDRDIQLSHPEGVDIRQYLETRGYRFDENGDITHITNKGVEIELNRAMKTESLIKSRRPSHIVYDKSISLDNDVNYQGYLVRGLNQQTPNFIVGVLDKNNLEQVIVDETGQSIPESDTSPATNPEVSAENLDILLESYRKQGFNEAQLAFIKKVIDVGDTTDGIALYAKPEYEVAQMMVEREKKLNPNLDISQYEELPHWQQAWIINGIRAGHTPEQISLYAKSGINSNEIEEIQSDIQNGLTIEQINEKQIKKRTEGYLNTDIGFSRDKLIRQIESEGFTNEKATQSIDSMDIDWSQQAIKVARSYLQSREASEGNWSKNELIRQLMSELEQFTDEQARFAVDNISDYDWKEDEEVATPEQDEGGETTPQVSLDDLRLAYARAEEAWNRKRGDEELEDTFIAAREAYNTELERVLKLQVAEGQEANIHQMFKDEFLALRDRRIEQSQELQGKWEKRFNPIKEKFVNFVIKHKKIISRLNLAAGVAGGALAGGALALTGVGIPLAGGLAVARRMVSATLLGVSTGEGIRSLGEDADINSFWGKIKFKAVIPKLVQESLASSEDEFKQVSEDVLKERLGTLEAYYRLNGGRFINDNQQQAYEKVLIELARRVQENVIYVENNKDTLQSAWQEQKPQELTDVEIKNLADENLSKRNIIAKSIPFSRNREIERQYDLAYEKDINWEKLNPERYTSELLNTISDTRITELDKFKRNRRNATIAGLGVGLLVGGAVHLSDEFNKSDSVELTDGSDSTAGDPTPEVGGPGAGSGGTGGAGAPEAGADTPKPNLDTNSPTGTGVGSGEALSQATTERVQDASNLSPKETVWGEIREWLGPNASEAQVQQVFENYANSSEGQKTIFNLANQTEGGRALLSQWGVDTAGEMAGLSKEQLYEVSKYLGEGKLDGLTELSLDNLDALEQAEYVAPSPTEAPTIEPGSTETPAPPAGTEDIGSKPPAPSSPPVTEAPVAPPSTLEAPPVATSEFAKDLSEILGKQNLTDIQAREIVQSYFADDYGREAIYNSIINTGEGATVLSNGFGVNTLADFANLTPDQMYEITNNIDSNELRKILNQTILARFEDAPDMVELTRGTNSLNVVQRYIANELGNLPYDANLGKQVLDTYVQTDAGKQWLYDAIVNNPDVNNQNIQYFKEYLRFKDIKSSEEFVTKFNWVEFSGNRNIPTSGFWNQIRLPNGGTRLQPLSTFLQPSKMIGIKDAVRQVLTRQ